VNKPAETIQQALTDARRDGKITCDRLEFFESYDDLPGLIRASIRWRLYEDESYAVAWRDGQSAWMSLARQLLEQAPSMKMVAGIVCQDLAAELDALEASCPQALQLDADANTASQDSHTLL
jgi:hypothetical protein